MKTFFKKYELPSLYYFLSRFGKSLVRQQRRNYIFEFSMDRIFCFFAASPGENECKKREHCAKWPFTTFSLPLAAVSLLNPFFLPSSLFWIFPLFSCSPTCRQDFTAGGLSLSPLRGQEEDFKLGGGVSFSPKKEEKKRGTKSELSLTNMVTAFDQNREETFSFFSLFEFPTHKTFFS